MSAARPTPSLLPARRAPREILDLSPEEADRLLDTLEAHVPVRPGFVELPARTAGRCVVFGDTHGDWRSTEAPVGAFLDSPTTHLLVGLGDYIDRAPVDCGAGSVANALWLLQLAAEFPDRVYLLTGNHEIVRRVPALPHDLPEEVDELWGPESSRYDRLLGLLERGPLGLRTENGVYMAHGGFPRGPPADWRKRFDGRSDDTLLDVTWSDCGASRISRGAAPPFAEAELLRFLELSGCRVFLRGHDPDLTGRPVFHDRCLTLHTTRHYERMGGVIYATFPMDSPIRTVSDVTVLHAPSEGRVYPEP